MNADAKIRLNKLIKNVIVLLCVGMGYYLFVMLTDIKIPCLFSIVTGLHCPGCGVSRMCIALIQLNFKAAFQYNQLVFCLLPFFFFEGIHSGIQYVRTGNCYMGKIRKCIWMVVGILVIVFGVLRNFDSFSMLRP